MEARCLWLTKIATLQNVIGNQGRGREIRGGDRQTETESERVLGNLHPSVKNIIIIDKNMKLKASLEELVVMLMTNKSTMFCINIGTYITTCTFVHAC